MLHHAILASRQTLATRLSLRDITIRFERLLRGDARSRAAKLLLKPSVSGHFRSRRILSQLGLVGEPLNAPKIRHPGCAVGDDILSLLFCDESWSDVMNEVSYGGSRRTGPEVRTKECVGDSGICGALTGLGNDVPPPGAVVRG